MTIDHRDDELDVDEAVPPGRARRRAAYLLIALLVVLILLFIPPLINVGRLQRRVDSEISTALGRPVHFDRLSLDLLPMPGFTLENFVIEEDPAFGAEPTLHADEVRINLRLSSLWRRRLEFSSISFTDPSVNLVHLSDGRWNIQGLLLQASRIPAAPTAQPHAGPAPRFPYIEATGARVNLKLDQEKTPVSLTEADLALWQPVEHQWRLRIEARPVRTDIAPGATGSVRIEGMLGIADTLAAMPIDMSARWQDAQLGGLTSLLLGRDAGLRGDLSANLAVLGTIGRNTITATLAVENARRADFVPPHTLSLSASCRARAESSFHAFPSIECRLPTAASSSQPMLALAASIPDVRRAELSSIRLDVPALPSQTLYDWLGVATPHPPTAFAGKGTLSGALEWGVPAQPSDLASGARNSGSPQAPQAQWTGELSLTGEWLKLPALDPDGAPLDDIVLRSTPALVPATRAGHATVSADPEESARDSFDLGPVSLPLGGSRPATLTGHIDDSGYMLRLNGQLVLGQLFALGDAIPQFGDGLRKLLAPEDSAAPPDAGEDAPPASAASHNSTPEAAAALTADLTATRAWGQMQVWSESEPAATPPHRLRK